MRQLSDTLRLLPAIAGLCATLFVAACAHAETERRSFAVSPGDRLVLEADWGSVVVTTGDGETVELVVENAERLDLDYVQKDDTLTIRGERPSRGLLDWGLLGWFRDWQGGPQFRLTVPRRHDLALTTRGGDIEVGDLEGELTARTSGGNLAIGAIAGTVAAKTSGGSIRIAAAGGSITARTSGGSIELGRAGGPVQARTSGGAIHIGGAAGGVSARTSGGSIHLDDVLGPIEARTSGGSIRAQLAAQPTRGSTLRTSGGDIEVGLADGIGLEVDAETSGGRVVTDLPVSFGDKLDNSSLRATVAGGGPLLKLRTSGGSIRLRAL